MIRYRFGKDQHEEKSSEHDDEDYLGGEVQSISKLHQDSLKIKWKTSSWEGAMSQSRDC